MSEDQTASTAADGQPVRERTPLDQQAEDAAARASGVEPTGTEPDASVGALQAQAEAVQQAAVRGEGSAASLVDNAQADPA